MAEEENCQIDNEITEDEEEPLPRANPDAPEKYPVFEGYVIQKTKEGMWFYRRAIRGQKMTFVCTCQQVLKSGKDPETTALELKKNQKDSKATKTVSKPAPKPVFKPVIAQPVSSPLPNYKAYPPVKPQFTNKRPAEDPESNARTDFFFNALNVTLNGLIQQIIQSEKNRVMSDALIEKNCQALNDLYNIMTNMSRDLVANQQTFTESIEKLDQVVSVLKTMQPPKILRPPTPPAKKQKMISLDLEKEDSGPEDILDLDFQKQAFRDLKKK